MATCAVLIISSRWRELNGSMHTASQRDETRLARKRRDLVGFGRNELLTPAGRAPTCAVNPWLTRVDGGSLQWRRGVAWSWPREASQRKTLVGVETMGD